MESQSVIFHADNTGYLELPDLMYNFVSKKYGSMKLFKKNKSVLNKVNILIYSEKKLLSLFSKPILFYR